MTQAFVELACKMTRDILRQTLGNYHLENVSKDGAVINKESNAGTNEAEKKEDDLSAENEEADSKPGENGIKKFPLSKNKPVNFVDVRVQAPSTGAEHGVEFSVKSVHVDSFNDCLKILENLNLVDCFDESE